MSAIYKGTWESTLTTPPQNGAARRHYQGRIFTHVKEGPIALCYAGEVDVGSSYSSGIVMDCFVEPTTGGLARLVIITDNRNSNYIYEVDWQQISKVIQLHPRYTGGSYTLNSTDWAHVMAAVDGQSSLYDGTAVDVSSAGRADALSIIRSFGTGYLVMAPIATRMRCNYLMLTVGSNIGTRSTSTPFSGAPTGYEWIKSVDRARKDGGYWERTEQWIGADNWPAELYGP